MPKNRRRNNPENIKVLEMVQKIKEIVNKWKANDFIASDGFAWDCMKEIADIVDEVEE